MPPPRGFGNSQRRTAWTVQFSTRALPIVEFCSDRRDDLTGAAMVNCTMTRPPRSGFFVSSCS